ncbi:hypothetical protein ACFQZ2_11370 [Streptomonospora algeriensis]
MSLLPAFTVRGWGLLSGGAALIASGLVIGERDLVGFGILVFALPLLAGASVPCPGPRRRHPPHRFAEPLSRSRSCPQISGRILARGRTDATRRRVADGGSGRMRCG